MVDPALTPTGPSESHYEELEKRQWEKIDNFIEKLDDFIQGAKQTNRDLDDLDYKVRELQIKIRSVST